ncbi:type II toxin-antitoxin system PemK/MazF family toxin [uncultured Cellulomonas sp.]|uniref:type II toxin-antitoxin system PemK/MazF family toxin n=1 Tax=uncultured Cellulomonas sp. TaxID=189682 RepID=UPI0028EF4A13|nr:type II toxin-antitoxin system PemK/MazF family toxin [uncultured Cellulomonas sp.]
MSRGEIWLVDLEPTRGAEANKVRPVVIVGHAVSAARAFSAGHGVVTVVPLTSNTARVLAFQVLVTARESGLDRDSKAQAEQVRSIDVRRFVRQVGTVAESTMHALNDALRLHLDL